MSRRDAVRVRVPASTANLGPGFDTLGMALDLYAWIEMRAADTTTFHLYGDELKDVAADKKNLVYKVAQMVFDEAGVSVPELEISMYSDIPFTRGLGSSASAIIGGLYAANALIGSPLTKERMFDMATSLEGHPDNVGASLFGGIITATWDGIHADYVRIEPPQQLEVLVVIPDFQLPTSKARDVLPQHISLQDAIFNISRSSLLVAALLSGRLDLIASAMRDRLHQPYRASLIPGMEQILEEATEFGALGIALSGAGPTMLALVDRDESLKGQLERHLLNTMKQKGVPAKSLWLNPSSEGVVVLSDSESCSFVEMIKGEVNA
ncbi:homoserine kinase [Paenibacillus sediminis]|uniref:Homoserine kinase n=1 Tax=Paenibacillus sediminis TaxID=664909 RepID=A0ABS4H776_9BACL|nr:homoserine kinase [Paenibacillus sediminis]MBP1938336.1 homoserine kinase [Paenibacillus sediminis]